MSELKREIRFEPPQDEVSPSDKRFIDAAVNRAIEMRPNGNDVQVDIAKVALKNTPGVV